MDKHAQDLAEAREDNRIHYFMAKRASAREEEIRADERRRMTERNDIRDPMTDETGFSGGARGFI